MSQRHRVFISFHHANDEQHKVLFERLFHTNAEALISHSVDTDDIDPNNKVDTVRREIRDRFISNTSVTVVLVGRETWQRKHVDWEIGYSLTQTTQNERNGLIGILLPTYPRNALGQYNPRTIPPRLADNTGSGYATIHSWPNTAAEIQSWVHAAFSRRRVIVPNNARAYFSGNHSGAQWT